MNKKYVKSYAKKNTWINVLDQLYGINQLLKKQYLFQKIGQSTQGKKNKLQPGTKTIWMFQKSIKHSCKSSIFTTKPSEQKDHDETQNLSELSTETMKMQMKKVLKDSKRIWGTICYTSAKITHKKHNFWWKWWKWDWS